MQKSLSLKKFPAHLKYSEIKPLFKKGEKIKQLIIDPNPY
jgi:hypothetical protein